MNLAYDNRYIESIDGEPFIGGNRAELLSLGKDSFTAIFKSIEAAKLIICLHFYIFRNDETGTKMAELLRKKSKEGVKVYILYDHFGSFGTPKAFWDDLSRTGIKIKASRPFKWSEPRSYAHRDHRKLIISDGIRAFTGGLNIANEYRGFHRLMKEMSWRDTGVMLEGPVAYSLFKIFEKTWHAWGGEPIPYMNLSVNPPDYSKSEFCLPVIPIFASSSRGRRRMRKLLYYSIKNSKSSIQLTTAYFTPSRRMLDSLEDAVKRGVDVKLLLPGISDLSAPYYAGRASFTRLLRAGIKIYTYQGQVLHAKTYVFDGCWSIVGSANLDFQSLRWNDEGNVGILDEGFGQKMTKLFEEDLTHSIEIKEDAWLQRPFLEHFKERFFVLFRRRL